MGLRGTDPFVEQVRSASDIVSVISSYLELRRAGKRWKGLCPFHTEKTPSFFVHEENQTFYCFGCHQGGDVFRFLMEQEKLTFPEALRMLADKAGIPMPQRRARDREEERLGDALEVAGAFYRERLRAVEGAAARSYLAQRGIDEAPVERFGLGWAPASWDALLRHARPLLPDRALLQAGLEIEGERGLYDRFRERVMIPIRTAGARIVAFGGRLLGPGEPKYLNSPETPLYKKGTVLFGLPEAREAIRTAGNVLVVEGYFDVIALSSAGLGWTVGTCGTALTPEQALLLRRYAERWTLLFDGDAAGRAAVLRALDAALPVHPGVKVALCPDGLDPDAWVRRDGPDALAAAIERALTPLQYLDQWGRAQGWSPEETLPRVAEMLRRLTDPLVLDRWVQEAAGRFRLGEARIWEAVGKRPAPAQEAPRAAAPGSRLSFREKQILAAAVRQPALAVPLLMACQDVSGVLSGCREILAWIGARSEEGVTDPASLLSRAAEDEALLRDLAFLHEETTEADPADEVPEEILRRLRGWGLRQRMSDVTARIRRAEEAGEDVGALLAEKQELARSLRELESPQAPGEGNFQWTAG